MPPGSHSNWYLPESVGLKDLLDMETAFDARASEEGSELSMGIVGRRIRGVKLSFPG